jgi:transposase
VGKLWANGSAPHQRRVHRLSGRRAQHPHVRLPFTPTYSSWLNQIEIWFAKIQRQVIARGIFSSVDDLRRKILRYIRYYNKTATPIRPGLRRPDVRAS